MYEFIPVLKSRVNNTKRTHWQEVRFEMTNITTQASDDDFDKVEQGIDWIEKLEGIRSRQDKESATEETVHYVERLRQAVTALAGDTAPHLLVSAHGAEVAYLVDSIRDAEITDPWTEYLLPSLVP